MQHSCRALLWVRRGAAIGASSHVGKCLLALSAVRSTEQLLALLLGDVRL